MSVEKLLLPTQNWATSARMEDIDIPPHGDVSDITFRWEGGTWTQGSTTGVLSDADEGILRILDSIKVLGNDGVERLDIAGKDLLRLIAFKKGKTITKTNPTMTASATSTPRFTCKLGTKLPMSQGPYKYRITWGTIQNVDGTGYSGSSLGTSTLYTTIHYGNVGNVVESIFTQEKTTVSGSNLDDILKHGNLKALITDNSADTILTKLAIKHKGMDIIDTNFKDLIEDMEDLLGSGYTRLAGCMFYLFKPFVVDDTSKFEYTGTAAETIRKIFLYENITGVMIPSAAFQRIVTVPPRKARRIGR